jgi:glycosyltransferase involved in cell wall biosynthesis
LLASVAPAEATAHKVDAIVVPSARTAPYLHHAAGAAEALGCPLVVLCSRYARRLDVLAFLNANPFLIDVFAVDIDPAAGWVGAFETSRLLDGTIFERRTDTSYKRNLGLALARMVGWRRLVFLDDDIEVPDPADLRRAAALLDGHDGVGLAVAGFPDNSVVCHAHRDTGAHQDTFVGGGALAVAADRVDSFFPKVYNEDWFFLLNDVRLRTVAQVGTVLQKPYDPYANPERARSEEFGDVLAEGVFGILDCGGRVRDADRRYWQGFLADRAALIDGIAGRTTESDLDSGQRARMLTALKAARGRLARITPDLCEAYLRAWRRDRGRWRRRLEDLPAGLPVEAALAELGHDGRYAGQRGRSGRPEPAPRPVRSPTSAAVG